MVATASRTLKERLITAINEKYDYGLVFEQVTFGLPVLTNPAVDDLSTTARNTSVNVSVGPDGATMSGAVRYNRLSIPHLFANESIDFDDQDPAADSTYDLLAAIGERLNLVLDEEDFDDTPIQSGDGVRLVTLSAKTNSYVYFGASTLNLNPLPVTDTTHHVDLTYARVYDNDQSGDGFLSTGISATANSLSVSNTNAGVNAFFDPYETGPIATSFYAQWDYATHYLYNANIYLTTATGGIYDPNIPDVYWVPYSNLYIEQRFQPKANGACFVDNVNVNDLNGTQNPSSVASHAQVGWFEQAQPTDIYGATIRTNVDIVFDGPGGRVLCTRHYCNDFLAAAYVWCSPLNVTASDTRAPLEASATMTMNTNGDSQPYQIDNMLYGPRAEDDPNYVEIAFDLGNMAANAQQVLNFEVEADDKIVVVTTASDNGDIDLFANVQAGAPGNIFSYAIKGENGGLRECKAIRHQSLVAANGTWNIGVSAYEASNNVRVRVIKIKA